MPGPVVITGGGTGGHVFAMQAVAEALVARGVAPDALRYVGSRRGQEAALLGTGPVALTLLGGRGLRRSLAPRDLAANVGAVLGLTLGVARATWLVARWRPTAVVSVGGYASFAVSLAAVVWRRPLILVELDAAPGAAHRVLARRARARCVAFDDGSGAVVTGAPVREAIARVDRDPAATRARRRALAVPLDDARAVVVVMTGSLGAARVNRAVVDLAALWADRADRAILHVTGRRDYGWVAAARPATPALDYRIEAFADMTVNWGLCDVAVCRAGATTVAELTVLGVAAVLVPLPGAPGDHQSKNADALARHGAATLLRDDACTGAALAAALDDLLSPGRAEAMAAAARTLGHRDAAARVAAVVLEARAAA
ncbi:MAG: UDP-N-acetylglucosamine--N-acetylmuramyl-(pentapeptide) pyrophosphoryl-undecaprenol N-acetylglucosamine transferase [Acidimicrobiales bacterium]